MEGNIDCVSGQPYADFCHNTVSGIYIRMVTDGMYNGMRSFLSNMNKGTTTMEITCTACKWYHHMLICCSLYVIIYRLLLCVMLPTVSVVIPLCCFAET